MTTIYTFTVHYKFDNDKEVNALQHTIISEGNYEQAAPVDITLRGE